MGDERQSARLGDLLNGNFPGRSGAAQITLFKNNAGQGVADVAIASKVYRLARDKGLGMDF
jgi:ornithine cyclodeaminase/alanine dehydrogenase-like protein (mu-crystallin family)